MVVILQVFDTFGPVKEAIIFHSCQLPGSCGRWDWRNTSSLRSWWGSTLSLPYRLTLSPSCFTPTPLHTLDLLALYSLPCFFTAPHSSPSHTSSHPTLFPLPHILTPHTLLPLSNMHPRTHTHFCHPHILTTARSSLPHILTPTLCNTLDPPSPSHPHTHTLLPLPHSTSHARCTHTLHNAARGNLMHHGKMTEIPAEVCGLRRVWDDVYGVWRLKYVCEMWGVRVVYMWHSMNEGTLLGDSESMTGGTHGTWS